jgi:hypothetical protein
VPIFPFELYAEFINTQSVSDADARAVQLHSLVRMLRPNNQVRVRARACVWPYALLEKCTHAESTLSSTTEHL